MLRRFINWFPLGMTYAFLYMGRYNLVVSKGALGSLMSIKDFSIIFSAALPITPGQKQGSSPPKDNFGFWFVRN